MNISSRSLRRFVALLLATALSGLDSVAAAAVTITGAVSATVNSGGSAPGANINDTFNQNGLSAPYVSDLTPFQPYVSNTLHTSVFFGFEWFSALGTTASVTYDLGELDVIDGVALWNEDAAGIGTLDLFWSPDNTTFISWATGLTPTNNPFGSSPYPADVFALTPVNARYVRFDMSNCPQSGGVASGCAIGEVAFRDPEMVPEPAPLALIALGLIGLGISRRIS